MRRRIDHWIPAGRSADHYAAWIVLLALAGSSPGCKATNAEPVRAGVASVTISVSSASLIAGETTQATAVVRDAQGNVLTGRPLGWTSSNSDVASVSGVGLISGVSIGSATITASSEGRSASVAITVIAVPVSRVAPVLADSSLTVGQTTQASATLRDNNGLALTGRSVAWTTSNGGVATVTAKGLVLAWAAGTVDVIATSEGRSAAVTLTVVKRPSYTGGSTVVIRVVGTSPSWGQEQMPAWPNASPIKDTTGYRLYDLEIGRDSLSRPAYVSLYKFTDWRSHYPTRFPAEFAQYFAASRIASVNVRAGASSMLEALKTAVTAVLQRERPGRLIVTYSGHGGPTIFFEGTLSMPDAKLFMQFVRQSAPDIPIVLDFSTNCNVGFFDFAAHFYESADYLIASEKLVGGFEIGSAVYTQWLEHQHDRNLYRFWQPSSTLDAAFVSTLTARETVWGLAAPSIQAGRLEESVAVYDLSELNALMRALAIRPDFDAVRDLPRNANDIGTYAYGTRDDALIRVFERFRTHYVSDRNLIPWAVDSRGFSVRDAALLRAFLLDRVDTGK